jgi:ribosome-binding protein aMBF1 (putative translation factor)
MKMDQDTFKPVALNHAHALAEAMKRPGFEDIWNGLEEEYAALHSLLQARKAAGLSQEEVALRMGTTKSAVSRLESSIRNQRHSPSFATLKKYANACGKRLLVQFV